MRKLRNPSGQVVTPHGTRLVFFYETSIDGGFAQDYADIDRDAIRLLYHPKMKVGLNEEAVDKLLRDIFDD